MQSGVAHFCYKTECLLSTMMLQMFINVNITSKPIREEKFWAGREIRALLGMSPPLPQERI